MSAFKTTAIIVLKISSATGQNSVTQLTRHFGNAHPRLVIINVFKHTFTPHIVRWLCPSKMYTDLMNKK
jgi:hypothetical protein